METSTLSFDNLQIALDSFINDFIKTYKSLLIRDDKKASGNLISSLKPVSIQFKNNKFEANISIASYWKYVEYGRKPGKMPPVSKILEWVRVKPDLPRPRNNAKPPTDAQLAFLIARKIGRDGIKPGNQLEEAINIVWINHRRDISDAISADLQEAVDLIKI